MIQQLDGFFHKKEEVSEPHTHHAIEAKRYKKELKRQKYFFRRKGINPQILYNTLIFITEFFDHREDEWEELLKLIIRENEHRRPNFAMIQYWFTQTFQKSLNKSETKYLCRYVKMSSLANDRDTKLRDSMDNIDLPPIKYESWLTAVYNLECDEDADIIKESGESGEQRSYLTKAFGAVAAAFRALPKMPKLPKIPRKNDYRKTYPDAPNKLSLSSKAVRVQQRRQNEQLSAKLARAKKLTADMGKNTDYDDAASTDNNLDTEGGDTIDHIRSFNATASTFAASPPKTFAPHAEHVEHAA